MHSSTHARHNIFTAEPLNSKAKKASRDNVKKVHFDEPSAIYSSPPSRAPSQPAATMTPPPSRNLVSIDFDARQKLAVKDLSVKYVHKSPTFNVNTTLGSPSSSSKLANKEDRAANILNDMFAFDDDADANSVSKASIASLRSHTTTGFENSQRGHSGFLPSFHNLDSQLDAQSLAQGSFGMTAGSKQSGKIMPNSYFFNDSHSVVEVEEEDDVETKHSTVILEEDGQGRIIQPHPKVFTSPLDAHKSFMNASKSRRSYQSMPNVKSIPTDLIANESRKAIISMKIASRSSHHSSNDPSRKGSSRSQLSADSSPGSSPSTSLRKSSSKDKGLFGGKFFFLSNLTRTPIQEEDEEDDDEDGGGHDGQGWTRSGPGAAPMDSSPGSRTISTKHDNVHGQKAPLESTNDSIVERPLRTSTFTRFYSHAASSSADGENYATLLRSMDSSARHSSQRRDEAGLDTASEAPSESSTPWQRPSVVPNSVYHVPKLAVLEKDKGFLHSVDRLIAKWTRIPKPEKPRTPSPVEEEPMTAQSLFGEHLIKADLSKTVPEDELNRLMRMTKQPPRRGEGHERGPAAAASVEIVRPTPISAAVRGGQGAPSKEASTQKAMSSSMPILPPLDLAPVRQHLQQQQQQQQPSYVVQPSISLGPDKTPSSSSISSPTLPAVVGPPIRSQAVDRLSPTAMPMREGNPPPHDGGAAPFLPNVVHSPQYTTEQSTIQNYLSFLSPASQSFLSSFLSPNPSQPAPWEDTALPFPQPLSESNPSFVYQHSTTSYVPGDTVNRSALGFDYHSHLSASSSMTSPSRRRPPADAQSSAVFSERHLANIEQHTAGQSEPVIYLPIDTDRDADKEADLLLREQEEEGGEERGEGEGMGGEGDQVHQERTQKSRSSSPLQPWAVLQPGMVLSVGDFRDVQRQVQKKDPTSILHYKGNIFEDSQEEEAPTTTGSGEEERRGEEDWRGEEEEEAGGSRVWNEYLHFLENQEGSVSSFLPPLSSLPSPDGAERRSVPMESPPLASSSPQHRLDHLLRASPRSEGSQETLERRSLEGRNRFAELNTPSSLDLRGEIAAFLHQHDSPLQQEYDAYVQKLPPSSSSYPILERPGMLPPRSMASVLADDNSTIASQERPSFGYYSGESPQESPSADTHERLRKNLQQRYGKDREGEYQMQRRVKKYLQEGLRTDTHIQRKYVLDDEIDEGW